MKKYIPPFKAKPFSEKKKKPRKMEPKENERMEFLVAKKEEVGLDYSEISELLKLLQHHNSIT